MIRTADENHRSRKMIDVYYKLKNAIQFLELKPGATISEAELAAELGVSRTPIREALIRLADELLVNIFPQSGTYVSKIDLGLVKEMTYMRHILETEICLNMCREKLKVGELLEEQLYMMQLAVKKHDTIDYIQRDDDFHRAIFAHNNHEAIWNIISGTRVHYNRVLVLDMSLPNSMEQSYQDHLRIVECIEAGNTRKLINLLGIHHDYSRFRNEKQLREVYADYFV